MALIIASGPAFAQKPGTGNAENGGLNQAPQGRVGAHPQAANSANPKENADLNFAKKAAESDMAEVKLGQLAEQKGSVPSVKDFGKRMIADHSHNEHQLDTVATQDSISLPKQPTSADQKMYDALAKLSGPAFDRAYARDMVKEHTQDIAKFRQEAKNGRNAAVKQYAEQSLPVLQTHLQLAQKMQETVSAAANNTGGSAPNTGRISTQNPPK